MAQNWVYWSKQLLSIISLSWGSSVINSIIAKFLKKCYYLSFWLWQFNSNQLNDFTQMQPHQRKSPYHTLNAKKVQALNFNEHRLCCRAGTSGDLCLTKICIGYQYTSTGTNVKWEITTPVCTGSSGD